MALHHLLHMALPLAPLQRPFLPNLAALPHTQDPRQAPPVALSSPLPLDQTAPLPQTALATTKTAAKVRTVPAILDVLHAPHRPQLQWHQHQGVPHLRPLLGSGGALPMITGLQHQPQLILDLPLPLLNQPLTPTRQAHLPQALTMLLCLAYLPQLP